MNPFRKNTRGFTLIELVITISILSIVLLFVVQLLISNMKAIKTMNMNIEYNQNLRMAVNQIMHRIKLKNTVKVTYTEGTGILTVDDLRVLDTVKKSTNENNAELWLYDSGSSAELRDSSGNSKVLAEYIEYIQIDDNLNENSYLNIRIKVANLKEMVLTVPKKYSFSMPQSPNGEYSGYVTFSNILNVTGGVTINAPTVAVYIKNPLSQLVDLNGGINIKASKIYIDKSLSMGGSALLGNLDRSSMIYVNGNVSLSGNPSVNGKLHYTGELNKGHWINVDAQKVTSIDFPQIIIPTPKNDEWYTQRGFTSNQTPSNGMKYIGNSYSFPTWDTYTNVCVYSKGAINLSGSVTVKGILYAPNGNVSISGGASFYGIIIAQQIDLNGGVYVEFQSFNAEDLPF